MVIDDFVETVGFAINFFQNQQWKPTSRYVSATSKCRIAYATLQRLATTSLNLPGKRCQKLILDDSIITGLSSVEM